MSDNSSQVGLLRTLAVGKIQTVETMLLFQPAFTAPVDRHCCLRVAAACLSCCGLVILRMFCKTVFWHSAPLFIDVVHT
jgi:hypothetical protein